jgi:hypothetical protein
LRRGADRWKQGFFSRMDEVDKVDLVDMCSRPE